MNWEKPSPELVELFDEIVPEFPGLEKRKMPVIRVYEDYSNYVDSNDMNEPLYYGTDTHWTERGLNMALNNTLKELRTLNDKIN